MKTIAAVVVTHNRLDMLKHCVASLLGQSSKINEVFVVNNGSTDGTGEWLAQQNNLRVFYQENIGSAGGFYTGIKLAYEAGYDWIWIMDDDAIPRLNCLELLLKAANKSRYAFSCYFPSVVEEDEVSPKYHGSLRFDVNLKIPYCSLPSYNADAAGIIPASFGSYLGMLLQKSTVEKAGFPNPDFFFRADDVEYCIRIFNECGKLAYVKDAFIDHRVVKLVKAENKIYTRSILGYTFPNTGKGSLPMRYFGQRNIIYLKTQHFKKHSAFKMFQFRLYLYTWYAGKAIEIIFTKPYKLIQVKFYRSFIADGLKGNFDNTKPFKIVFGEK